MSTDFKLETGESMAGLAPTDSTAYDVFVERIRAKEVEPERALLLAVLWDAFIAATDKRTRAPYRQNRQEALEWFGSDDRTVPGFRTYPYTFLNVCEALDLDAEMLRKKIADKNGKCIEHRRGRRRDAA